MLIVFIEKDIGNNTIKPLDKKFFIPPIKKIDYRILKENPELELQIAELYKEVYSAPPWNEEWTIESALNELNEVKEKEGFTGVIYEEREIIGFSWGYKLPKKNTSRVDFEKINLELKNKNINPELCFYGAETGVQESSREKGIGSKLLKERTKFCINFRYFLFRTKNPQMLRLYQKQLGNEILAFPEESSYKDGKVYVCENKMKRR